jgi:gas vesicle protein
MSSESDGFRTGFAAGIGFFLGLATGAVLGLLYAPKPGVELRKDIKEKAVEFYEKGREVAESTAEKIKTGYESSKKKVAEVSESIGERIQDIKESAKKISDLAKEKTE